MATESKTNTKTVDRVVKAQFFRYTKLVPVPGSDTVRPVIRTARRGDTVQVLETEAERGAMLDAFHNDAAITTTPEGEVVELDVREMSDAELASWIKTDRPKADEVVDLAEGDATLAERLLNAERTATNGKPRKTVNTDLTKIIDARATAGSGVETEGTA